MALGIKDIALMAGVSPSTVSNVLNGRKNAGEKTRERVLEICAQNNYTPDIIGKNLKLGTSNTIAFNFSDFDRAFYLEVIKGISDSLSESGYDLIICTNTSSVNFMRSNLVRGAICLDSKMTDEYMLSIASPKLPLVVLDRVIKHPNVKSVVLDNYPVMCQLVQQLCDKGFKKFGFIGGIASTLDNSERFSAFADTLEKNSLSFDKRMYFNGDYREKSGYQTARILILGNSVPEVLVCANDSMAIGAIKAFRESGIEVPKDVAVTGFDDGELAAALELTTVTVPRYEAGYLAVKELLELIQGAPAAQPVKLRAEIVWRGTV